MLTTMISLRNRDSIRNHLLQGRVPPQVRAIMYCLNTAAWCAEVQLERLIGRAKHRENARFVYENHGETFWLHRGRSDWMLMLSAPHPATELGLLLTPTQIKIATMNQSDPFFWHQPFGKTEEPIRNTRTEP